MAARLTDLKMVEEIQVAAGVISPSGLWQAPSGDDVLNIEMAQEYVLVTLRQLPLTEEGLYSFQLLLSGQSPVCLTVPVSTVHTMREDAVH